MGPGGPNNQTKYRISPLNIDRRLTNILTYILWSDILFLQTLFHNLSVTANKINIFRDPFPNIFTIINLLALLNASTRFEGSFINLYSVSAEEIWKISVEVIGKWNYQVLGWGLHLRWFPISGEFLKLVQLNISKSNLKAQISFEEER